ncbi:MAG: hypothetical protein V1743_08240 [Nanoarchaeota archaeon]
MIIMVSDATIVFGVALVMLLALTFSTPADRMSVGNAGEVVKPIEQIALLQGGEQDIEGTLFLIEIDDFMHPENSRTAVVLSTDSGYIELKGIEPEKVLPGSKVKVKGRLGEYGLWLTDGYQVTSDPFQKFMAQHAGQQHTLVLVGYWDDAPYPISLSHTYGLLFGPPPSMADFFYENSDGATWFTGSVFGPYRIGPQRPTQCNLPINELIAAADPYVDFTAYDRLIFTTAGIPNCPSVGGELYVFDTQEGEIAVSCSFTFNWGSDTSFIEVATHEMGHQFGVGHSKFLQCQHPFGENTSGCIEQNYGNPISVMGSGGLHHFTAIHKQEMGFLTDQDMQEASTGILSLYRTENYSDGVRKIRIQYGIIENFLGHSSTYEVSYVLEYRQPFGYDSESPIGESMYSVQLLLEAINTEDRSVVLDNLIDTTFHSRPYLWEDSWDAGMMAGNGYHDNNIGQTINVLSMSPEGAQVQLFKDPEGCRRSFPNVTLVSQTPTPPNIQPGTLVSYTARVKNADVWPQCGMGSNFRISVNALPGFSVCVNGDCYDNTETYTILPQQSVTFSFTARSLASAPTGNYPINISVKNTGVFYYNTTTSANYAVQTGGSPIFRKVGPPVRVMPTTTP